MRMIKPELFTHEQLYETEKSSGFPIRVAFMGLLTQCDPEGRFEWRPLRLKLAILPWDDVDFAEVLTTLETASFINRYVVDGKEIGCIPSWSKHQKPHHQETRSTLPAAPDPLEPVGDSPKPVGDSPSISPEIGIGVENGVESEFGVETPGGGKTPNLPLKDEAARLADVWVFELQAKRSRSKRDKPEDIATEVAEWMRVGVPAEEIDREIKMPGRDRSEFLWQLKKRLFARLGKATGPNGKSSGFADTIRSCATWADTPETGEKNHDET
jgi:hypothetical protein